MAEQNDNANPNPNPDANANASGGDKPVADASATSKGYTYTEDRSDWVPRHRLNEVSTKAGKLEKELGELRTRFEDQDKRVKTVFGIDQPSKEESDATELREAIYKILPGAKLLEKLSEEQLEEVLEAARQSKSSTVSQAERHARGILDEITAEVAAGYGQESLTERQRQHVLRAYRDEAKAAYNARYAAAIRGERDTLDTLPSDKDFLARHDRGDKTLIKEFAKEFLNDWFEPARRSAQSQVMRRNRPLPSGERSRTPVTSKTPDIDYNNEDAFKKALIEARAG